MMEIKTESGFVCNIADSAANDMELLDLFVELDETEDNGQKTLIAAKLSRKLLGEEGRKALYEFVRTEEGNVPIDKFMEIFSEIISGMGEDKKK